MTMPNQKASLLDRLEESMSRRVAPHEAAADDAEALSLACYAMAERFLAGGKLIVFGAAGASSDAQHVSVEFVHPVIVGKRALQAISLSNDVATVTGIGQRDGWDEIFAKQLMYLGSPNDIALGVSARSTDSAISRAFEEARRMGLLTVFLASGEVDRAAADHVLVAATDDPLIVKELHVTMYHILWELVHVFFEQGIAKGNGDAG